MACAATSLVIVAACLWCGCSGQSSVPTTRSPEPIAPPPDATTPTATIADRPPPDAAPVAPPSTASGGSGGALGTQRSWPCTSCITTVPDAYDPAVATPLVISLHGDEGSPKASHGVWQRAARDNGYILLSPACPRDLGCTGRWGDGSWHRDGPAGSVAWITAQIDAVEAAYNIDRSRIYLVGGSRGAVYVGFHAHALAPRIAGAAMYAGGYSSLTSTCASCALPVYILVGDRDYLLDIAIKARDWFVGCGSQVVFDKLRGVTHRGAGKALLAGKAKTILYWFSARPNTCVRSR
jgi:predicted esterase